MVHAKLPVWHDAGRSSVWLKQLQGLHQPAEELCAKFSMLMLGEGCFVQRFCGSCSSVVHSLPNGNMIAAQYLQHECSELYIITALVHLFC